MVVRQHSNYDFDFELREKKIVSVIETETTLLMFLFFLAGRKHLRTAVVPLHLLNVYLRVASTRPCIFRATSAASS